MKKRIVSLLLIVLVMSGVVLTAHAHDVPQERNDCSIEILVQYDGKDINGGTLTAIRVGYVAENNGDYFFRRVQDDIRLEDVQSVEAVSGLQKFYEDNKTTYLFEKQTVDVKDGKASFTNLPTGLYLIIQEKAAKGYSKLSAFLVSVPYMKDGKYQYELSVAIKTELEREPDPTPPPTRPTDPRLPQTGQLNWPIPMMVISGLFLFTTGWLLRFGNKRKRDEK